MTEREGIRWFFNSLLHLHLLALLPVRGPGDRLTASQSWGRTGRREDRAVQIQVSQFVASPALAAQYPVRGTQLQVPRFVVGDRLII